MGKDTERMEHISGRSYDKKKKLLILKEENIRLPIVLCRKQYGAPTVQAR